MDLMFDVQAWRLGAGVAADTATLGSIAGYYRRVTTEAFPMNRLIGAVMLVTVAAAASRALRARTHRWLHVAAFVLAAGPIVLAALRVLPNAVRLGSAADPVTVQARLARAILHDHIACFIAIALFVAVQAWISDGAGNS